MDDENNMQVLKDKIDQLNKQAWELRVNDSTQANVLSQEAVKLSNKIDYIKGKAEGLRTLGFTLIRLSKHNEASPYLEESLPLFESLNDEGGQSDVHGYFGVIKRLSGDYAASLKFFFKALELQQKIKDRERESLAFYHIGVTYKYLGNFEDALDYLLKSLSLGRSISYEIAQSYALNQIGLIYFETGDYRNAVEYYYQSLNLRRKSGDKWGEAGCLDNIGLIHFKLKDYDNALQFCSQALSISQAIDDKKGQNNALFHLGNIHEKRGNYQDALDYYNESLIIRRKLDDKKGEAEILLFLAELNLNEYFSNQYPDQSLALLQQSLKLGEEIKAIDLLAKIHFGFYKVHKHFKQHEEAITYLEKYIGFEKELHTAAINQKVLNLEISHEAEESKKEAEIFRLRNLELATLYDEIKKQKEEIEVQKEIADEALFELKATQSQLIQREKMASLGELTAGIAHEIQNPLNFVNNFSEVNKELIAEMKSELNAGNTDEAISIANNIEENEGKISHHGKRADDIVKGMLQHSRISSGQKEFTNINALAEEYLRLSYHGLRAKDKTFNSTLKKDFDQSLDKINIVAQDIGRVLLNLYNNAFYAVAEKKKRLGEARLPDGQGYEPTVSVSTKKHSSPLGVGGIEIRVKDNGMGIPQKVLDKIFQPFFTTKPTGQGTGLGLSLSYDIIKAHGGELKVETREGEFAEFIILLPSV